MDELDALLAESLEKPEPDTVGAIIKRYKESLQYTPEAVVVLFRRDVCSCGQTHYTSMGTFLAGTHKASRSRRLTPTTNVGYSNLPRVVEYHTYSVGLCVACAHSHGFVEGI